VKDLCDGSLLDIFQSYKHNKRDRMQSFMSSQVQEQGNGSRWS
jgi:hypothetical protein